MNSIDMVLGVPRGNPLTLESTPLKFGPGISEEVGWELRHLGVRRAMIVSDPRVTRIGITGRIHALIENEGIECETFERSRVEPTLGSFQEAADFALEGGYDGFVGVGGGSSLDTAKVADLASTHPAPILDYVNLPIGGGRKPPSPLRPLIAIPTTAGSGSEVTSNAVLDTPEHGVKTAISHRYLQPHCALVDPLLSRALPKEVMASSGLDVLCQALEYLVALSHDALPVPDSPDDRPTYQGSNPISDLCSEASLRYSGQYLVRAVENGEDVEARGAMMLAAAFARIGFAPAGVHIPHACAYPIASLKHAYQPPGYPKDHPFVPHGWSVIVTAPAAFRYTFSSSPKRHRRAAQLLGGKEVKTIDKETLPKLIVEIMRKVGAPCGLRELGYEVGDVATLVEGALKQERILKLAPRKAGASELTTIFRESMENW